MSYPTKINEIEYTINDDTLHQLERYEQQGEIPADFLRTVLSNNFTNAITFADSHNLQNLPAFAKYLYWEMPSNSWGSTEKIMKWYAHNGISGYKKGENKGKDDAEK